MDRWTGLPSAGTPSRGWGARAYSCNRGQRCHKYDEGSTRLISPHFAIPISGWTRARIHVGPGGRQRRRRRPFHRRKPVLAVRQGGSMPCNGFTAPIRHGRPDPPRETRTPIPQQQLRIYENFLTTYCTYYLLLTVTHHIAPKKTLRHSCSSPRCHRRTLATLARPPSRPWSITLLSYIHMPKDDAVGCCTAFRVRY